MRSGPRHGPRLPRPGPPLCVVAGFGRLVRVLHPGAVAVCCARLLCAVVGSDRRARSSPCRPRRKGVLSVGPMHGCRTVWAGRSDGSALARRKCAPECVRVDECGLLACLAAGLFCRPDAPLSDDPGQMVRRKCIGPTQVRTGGHLAVMSASDGLVAGWWPGSSCRIIALTDSCTSVGSLHPCRMLRAHWPDRSGLARQDAPARRSYAPRRGGGAGVDEQANRCGRPLDGRFGGYLFCRPDAPLSDGPGQMVRRKCIGPTEVRAGWSSWSSHPTSPTTVHRGLIGSLPSA
ncbi:hypothetical protein J2Y69_002672 [Microbacterium resistens]|uniref:Uncharacterized protein n=1 Tax=Microbacterium resistens TaxID=156977 RepID=A0ABU1SEM5_9MICO|nr:hypothetical protein [Microbacterium resistens]